MVSRRGTGPYLDLAPGDDDLGGFDILLNVILGTSGSPFLMTGTHILGFDFVNAVGMTNYGYMTMSNTGARLDFPDHVLGWSFDNTGAAITVPVPEPATRASKRYRAALGALGLREWRRQRAA